MRATLGGLGVAITLLCAGSSAQGQKATERFIPIGQSPGVSQKYASIGPISDVNARDQTVTIAEPAGPRTIRISKKTRIWLDRTPIKRPNLTGRFADLKIGRRAEVKYEDPERRQVADWVKVEITEP